MKVLVTFAVDAEFAPWKKRWRFKRRAFPTTGYGSGICHSATVQGVEVDVFLTGIGLRGAEPAFGHLLAQTPDACVSTGLAGGLHSSLEIGQIVAARETSDLNTGVVSFCNKDLVEVARESGAMVANRFVTSDHVLRTVDEKRIAGALGDVVEMEGYWILSEASEKWIPTVLVRAISDTSGESLPIDFNRTIDSKGNMSLTKILTQVIREPRRIPRLVEFGRRSRIAAESLAEFLDRYIANVSKTFQKPARSREQVTAR